MVYKHDRLNPNIDIRTLKDPNRFMFGKSWAGVNLYYYMKWQKESGNNKPMRFKKMYDEFCHTMKLILALPASNVGNRTQDGFRYKRFLLHDTMRGYTDRLRRLKLDQMVENYALSVLKTIFRNTVRIHDPLLQQERFQKSEKRLHRAIDHGDQ